MTGGEPPILAVGVGGLVGLSLGVTGSGGSLMAIPLLVYVLGTSVQEAASLSLALVAAAAGIGAIESFQSGLVNPHCSRGFMTKPPRRQARRARGAAREGGILKQYVDRWSGEPARRQACRSGVSAGAVEAFVNYAG